MDLNQQELITTGFWSLTYLGPQSKRDAKVFLTLLLQVLVMQVRSASRLSFQIFLPSNVVKDFKQNKN